MPAAPVEIRITAHPSKDKWVVNTPDTHIQRQPRTYGSQERAQRRAHELRLDNPEAVLVEVVGA
jgi:hypothetical protein